MLRGEENNIPSLGLAQEHKQLVAHLPLEELLQLVCGPYTKCGHLAGMQTFFLRPFLLIKLLTLIKKTPDDAFVEEEQWVSQGGSPLERRRASICTLPTVHPSRRR